MAEQEKTTIKRNIDWSLVYPEIFTMSLRDVREAVKLGWLNWSSLTELGRYELRPRLTAMEQHLHRLENCRCSRGGNPYTCECGGSR